MTLEQYLKDHGVNDYTDRRKVVELQQQYLLSNQTKKNDNRNSPSLSPNSYGAR